MNHSPNRSKLHESFESHLSQCHLGVEIVHSFSFGAVLDESPYSCGSWIGYVGSTDPTAQFSPIFVLRTWLLLRVSVSGVLLWQLLLGRLCCNEVIQVLNDTVWICTIPGGGIGVNSDFRFAKWMCGIALTSPMSQDPTDSVRNYQHPGTDQTQVNWSAVSSTFFEEVMLCTNVLSSAQTAWAALKHTQPPLHSEHFSHLI